MNKKRFLAFVIIFTITISAQWLYADANPNLSADLKNANGESIGKVAFEFNADGSVKLLLNAEGLSAGEHAFHIHDVGECIAPDFQSAGSHFNPEQKQHGKNNPAGHHAGDLPNILVSDDGFAAMEVEIEAGRLTEAALLDGDGTSVLIHERADDYATDPAGNAGARIACGVINKS